MLISPEREARSSPLRAFIFDTPHRAKSSTGAHRSFALAIVSAIKQPHERDETQEILVNSSARISSARSRFEFSYRCWQWEGWLFHEESGEIPAPWGRGVSACHKQQTI